MRTMIENLKNKKIRKHEEEDDEEDGRWKMNGANFLTCSQGLNCGGTREVRSDVSILKAPLAAASVHCDHTSPTQTYDGTNRDRPQHRALRALLFANSACVLLRPTN